MLQARLNFGSCSSAFTPISAVGWNARLEKYDSGYQYLRLQMTILGDRETLPQERAPISAAAGCNAKNERNEHVLLKLAELLHQLCPHHSRCQRTCQVRLQALQ